MGKEKKRKKGWIVLLVIVLLLAVGVGLYIPYNNGTFDKMKLDKAVKQADEALAKEDYESAKNLYAQAIELDPKNSSLYVGLAKAVEETETPEEAAEVLQNAVGKVDSEKTAEIKQAYEEVSEKTEKKEELKVWENKTEEANVKMEKTDGGLQAKTAGADVQVTPEGDIFITISDITVSDKYTVNKAAKGETECMWKVIIDTSLGKFGVVTKYVSDGSSEKEIAPTDMESRLVMYVLGKEREVGDAGFSYTSDSISWGFSTIDNLPVNKIKVNSCNVEIYDAQNMIHFERTYNIN